MVETLNRHLFNQAKRYIPGGVNSPARSFRVAGGYPIFINHGKGSNIYGECGKEFIDYCLSWGALILGHAHPEVLEEIKKTAAFGLSFGTPTKSETELARAIITAMPSIEKIRLTNSGTEAVMGAIRVARGYTGRYKIIKFSGSYHGHADYLLDCAGIPEDFTKYTLVLPYNNIKKTEEIVRKYHKDIAAIIVEPVAANMGVVLPKDGFLPALREITKKFNIILIFDEVITGFRLSYGGAQELFKISADLTCLGKIIGGGLPVGAFGGRRELMQELAPEGEVFQAGTFSGNPVVVNAGLATLRRLAKDNPYRKLEALTRKLCENIKQSAQEYGVKIEINFIGSMFSISFRDKQAQYLFKRFYHGLLKEGIYLSPSNLETNFLSTAHSEEDIEKTLDAVDKVFKNLTGRQNGNNHILKR